MIAAVASQGFRDRPHAAAHETPGTLVTVQIAEEVVELHIGTAGRARAEVHPDDPTGAERCLDALALEKGVQYVGDAADEEGTEIIPADGTGEGCLELGQ
ncbi:hypothetical protein HRbin27_01191 [bacterium HR27]|nr:hypothetical protein HRbin27_01191 [bacterium HR27]